MTANAQPDPADAANPGASATPDGPGAPAPGPPVDERDLEELRAILFAGDRVPVEELSRVLPQAVTVRNSRDSDLTTALQPTVEEALGQSVRRNPKVLVDALFPVMGPAIRKAVSSALSELVQSLNRTLEHSFSIQGLKWRLEALRTGKPFAEIVLANSLVFRVEQVFLIHGETGLLLQHVVAPAIDAPDGELVSGMLTAIQDFARDSLNAGEGEVLESARVGELTVWVERGPSATLATVIRGDAPQDLRRVMQESLEAIHREQGALLASFEGDAEPFVAARPHLEACLDARYATEPAKPSPVLTVMASVLGLLLLLWIGLSWWHAHKWSVYVDSLRAQPGIVVADEGTKSGKYYVAGLRDPLARDPNDLLREAGVDPSDVVAKWEPYISFAPELLPERARLMLEPPDTVRLSVENGAVVATGTAPHLWIVDARRIVRAMPGVAGLDERGLVDTDFEEMMAAKKRLESVILRFDVGSPELVPGQEAELAEIGKAVSALQDGVRKRGVTARIRIVGHTDSSGTEAMNAQLSEQRARTIYGELSRRGADATTAFEPVGVATGKPVREESSPEDAAMNRSVTFEVTIDSGR